MHNLPGYAEACKVRDKYLSLRAKHLASLESYVEGTQYAGLPDFFSDKKPLWERAPCIVYPIVKSAIDSNGDLLLGEGRFPTANVAGLEGDDASNFEKAVVRVAQQSRLRAASRESFAAGQGCGSSCAVFGVRGGRLFIDTVLARWCKPELALDGSVISLEIKYPYLTVVETPAEKKVVCKLYRRTIDAQKDVTYAPAEGREDGKEPSWSPDREVVHGLGFCPVIWYPHMRGSAPVEDFDGRAIHEHLTDEIRAHDFALSQRHRAALYAGDPQWTECGVMPGYNPTGSGRKAEVPASVFGRPGETPHASYVSGSATNKARKKSPGTVWQYESTDVKVTLHTLPGDALKALDDHAKDLRMKLAESLGVVFIDAESLPNESRISGRALESFKARQLDRVDYYRSDFGDCFLLPAVGMLLRIAIQVGLVIDGLDVVKKVASTTPQWSWYAPPIDFLWGEYFKATGEEEELMVRAVAQAKVAGVLTRRKAVEKLSGILGIRDIDAYMGELEAELEEAKKEALETVAAEAKAVASAQPKKESKSAAS